MVAHFLSEKKAAAFYLDKPRAAVLVRKEGNRLVVVPGIHVLKADTLMFWLPDKYKVVNENGERIKPTGKFAVTAETLDPYHAVVDIFK